MLELCVYRYCMGADSGKGVVSLTKTSKLHQFSRYQEELVPNLIIGISFVPKNSKISWGGFFFKFMIVFLSNACISKFLFGSCKDCHFLQALSL